MTLLADTFAKVVSKFIVHIQESQVAILNANYMAKRLSGHYDILYTDAGGYVAHEFIVDCRKFEKKGDKHAAQVASKRKIIEQLKEEVPEEVKEDKTLTFKVLLPAQPSRGFVCCAV